MVELGFMLMSITLKESLDKFIVVEEEFNGGANGGISIGWLANGGSTIGYLLLIMCFRLIP